MQSSTSCNLTDTAGEDNFNLQLHGLLDDLTFSYLTLASTYVFSGLFNAFGVIFNCINIIVFIKLGFTDTINISLLSLAIADIGIHITMIGYVVIYSPDMAQDKSKIELIYAIGYLILAWPHVMFSRISGCLTAFISLERFLCIAVPLKVKALITPKRTAMVSCAIYGCMICSVIPAFVANRIGPKSNEDTNVTVIGLVLIENSDDIENISFVITIFVELSVYTLVVIFTVGLIRKYVDLSKWRNHASSSSKNSTFSTRDKVLVNMVLFISCVFIFCTFPVVVGTVVMLFIKDYSVKGKEVNVFLASFSMIFNMASLNPTVSIFIYLKMSSKFNQMFWTLFPRRLVAAN
ncbi:adenosine receptor A1-like [Physella acuta]|uniref:adenosine receptor A1-like n=1 Tax=Physella acuta TaxID=109671 RepID=UPI0027DE036C|nr:adenosine receptor A1-like [Physella acuta]